MDKEITSIKHQLISWQKGHHDSYILNVDGSAQTNSGMAGFGGLIRDFDGQFLYVVFMVILATQIFFMPKSWH